MAASTRRTLVTGAGRRLGAAIAETLADAGHEVILHVRASEPEAQALAARIRAAGGHAHLLVADLSDPSAVDALADRVLALGAPYGLVNNAAVWPSAPFGQIGAEDWGRTLAVNLEAPMRLAQRLGPAMRNAGRGAIVTLTDSAADHPPAGALPYIVSKGAIAPLTRALARELAPEVRVNAIALGPILPPDRTGTPGGSRRTPLEREGSARDVAEAVRFLLDEATYVTGEVLPMDGARSLVPAGAAQDAP